MASQQTTASIFAQLGERGRKAHAAAKDKPVEYDQQDLPPGIIGGIAQLVKVGAATYKEGTKTAGKPYIQFTWVAKFPVAHNGAPVSGTQFRMRYDLFDTPDRKTLDGRPRQFEDNYADFVNELKKLNVDVSKMTFDTVPGILDILSQKKPHSKFHTRGWTPAPTPENPKPATRSFPEMDGYCDPPGALPGLPATSANAAAAQHVDDETPPVADVVEQDDIQPDGGPPLEPPHVATASGDGEDDVAGLVAAAKSADEKVYTPAQRRLEELAKEAGYSDDEVTNAADWDAVAAMIAAPKGGEGGASDDPWAGNEPVAGDEYGLDVETEETVKDPKNPKKTIVKKVVKRIPVGVLTSDNAARTVTLRSEDTGKPIMAGKKPKVFAWDDLKEAP